MDMPSYVLLSQEQALQRRLEVAANNMANMNTSGFKAEQPVFHEYVAQAGDTAAAQTPTTSFVLDYGAIHDLGPGAFDPTGNPLDVMIEGPGYLAVSLPAGGTAYTRAGSLKLSPTGELTAANGGLLQGEGGSPITIPPEQMGQVSIASDGTVSTPQGPVGRIAVTTFGAEGSVTPRGDGLFDGKNGTELPAAETRLTAGGIEGSNVQPIAETTKMVEILRAYQSSVAIASSLNDMRQHAIDQLGKAS
ncbi:flagellar hook-basal body complex protein [Sphingomonas sp. PAMC 26605]|uniref:flagellar hook-basal body complex protein n=1 Tax=Sphingomonas sp. PAMC 26605 TaxID=1112214 RepID=UPI00026CD6B4|nr:flagellar hook-basal body complex protein [Sphingomonas sp. PAMC 26605]